MQVDLAETTCHVIREHGDPVFRDGSWGSGESRLLYHVRNALREQGHDVIKKRMWKDGHMVSEEQLYLRTRDRRRGFMVWNSRYQIEAADVVFNECGDVILAVERYP